MKRIIIFCLISIAFSVQSQTIRNKELSFSIGMGDLKVERFAQREHIDFMNYMDFDPDYSDFVSVKFGYKFDFLSNMSASIKLIMLEDIIPDNYDVSVHYFVKPWLGIGVGSKLTKSWMSNFEKYQIDNFSNYYLLDDNVQQFTIYDLGFYLSPLLKPIDNDIFKLHIKCNFGLSSFMNEKVTFHHKKNLSNERMLYKYETNSKPQMYIQPQIAIRLKVFKIKNIAIGALLSSNYYYSKRSIDYFRSIQTWTSESKISDQITPSKHHYKRFEVNLGVFLKR